MPPTLPPTLPPTTNATNATAAWLAGEIAANGLHEYLCRALGSTTALGREDAAEISDHVQAAYAAWINRDAFGKHLAAGLTPRRRNLVAWAKQVSANTLRDRGTDALHRELRGARTEHEREAHADAENGMAPWAGASHTSYVAIAPVNDGGADEVSGYDLVDLDAADAAELLARADLARTCATVFQRGCPRSKEAAVRLTQTFNYMAEGRDLPSALDVSPLRAEKLAQRVRDRLRESEAQVRAALSVLRVVADEPCVTRAEVAEVLGDLSDLPSTVSELVERGYLTDRRGSLTLTGAGRSRLTSDDGWADRLLL